MAATVAENTGVAAFCLAAIAVMAYGIWVMFTPEPEDIVEEELAAMEIVAADSVDNRVDPVELMTADYIRPTEVNWENLW